MDLVDLSIIVGQEINSDGYIYGISLWNIVYDLVMGFSAFINLSDTHFKRESRRIIHCSLAVSAPTAGWFLLDKNEICTNPVEPSEIPVITS